MLYICVAFDPHLEYSHKAGVRLAHQGIGPVHAEDHHVDGRGVVGDADPVSLRHVLPVMKIDAS